MSAGSCPSDTRARRVWPKPALLAVAGLLLAVTLGFQWLTGTFNSELGGEPDEAPHFMNGLCLHDYLLAHPSGSPLHYFQNYYDHYPKLAVGHWPPLFSVLQAGWMLVFPPDRASVLLLMGCLSATVATVLFSLLWRRVGLVFALAGALLFLSLPLAQRHASVVMLDILQTLWCLAATLCWGRYLDRQRPGAAIAFGIFAALAMLTKQTGLALVAVPLVSLAVTGQWSLPRKLSFWLPALIVAGLSLPWYWLAPRLADPRWSWDAPIGREFTCVAVVYYLQKFYLALGAGIVFLALLGMAGKFRTAASRKRSSIWAALLGLLVGVLVVHMTIPVAFEARYLLPALPAAVAFAIAGAADATAWLTRKGLSLRLAGGLVLGAATLAFATETFAIPRKEWRGYGTVAQWVIDHVPVDDGGTLVVTDVRGEGMFITEVALREQRPGHVILRATKVLASSTWNGTAYHTKFTDKPGLMKLLRDSHAAYLVFDESLDPRSLRPHQRLLADILATAPPGEFALVAKFPMLRCGAWHADALRIYRVTAT